MGHQLPQFDFLVGVFDDIDLIDDIDQMIRFDDTPKYPVDADAQFPFVLPEFAEQQKIRLPEGRHGYGVNRRCRSERRGPG